MTRSRIKTLAKQTFSTYRDKTRLIRNDFFATASRHRNLPSWEIAVFCAELAHSKFQRREIPGNSARNISQLPCEIYLINKDW